MDIRTEYSRKHYSYFSRSRFLQYVGVAVRNNKTGNVCNGHHAIGDTIACFNGGLLHSCVGTDGKPKPAIEQGDGHLEWWDNGRLHRFGGPAVIAEYGAWEEFWVHGELIMIHSYGEEYAAS